MTATITPTRRPWHQRVLDLAREHFGLGDRTHAVDPHAPVDSDNDAGQTASAGHTKVPHLRVVGGTQHR